MPFLPILTILCPWWRLWAEVQAGVKAAGQGSARVAGLWLHLSSAPHKRDSPAVLAGPAVIFILYTMANRASCAVERAGKHGQG